MTFIGSVFRSSLKSLSLHMLTAAADANPALASSRAANEEPLTVEMLILYCSALMLLVDIYL